MPTSFGSFPRQVLNIHPSLLPAFPGLDAARQALDYGVKITGCTVHFVDEFLDSGPIVIQSAVPFSMPTRSRRFRPASSPQEHVIYSKAIQYIVDGRVRI